METTQMLDFCPKRKHRLLSLEQCPAQRTVADWSSRRGFTLLEVLVVLAIVGLLTAFSLPQFSVIRDSLEFTLNRESFERDLAGLSYLAFKDGRPLVLAGKYPRQTDGTTASDASNQPVIEDVTMLEPGQLRPSRPALLADAPLNLPATWKVAVDNPIYYQVSGFCNGGAVKLTVGNRTYVYDVKAPLCRAELK